MIDWAMNKLAAWSVHAYEVIVQLYPYSFRCECGESMIQLFRDLVRDAWKQSGAVGLAALWTRTLVDLVSSLFHTDSTEKRDSMFGIVVAVSILYVCTLALATGYGAIRFGEFYQPPAFSSVGAPEQHEDVLIAAYEQALTGEFGRYRTFALGASLMLAVLMGVATAAFGVWQRSILLGTGAFAAGAVLTIVAVSLLPTIWFPLDRYPVGALWVMGGSFPLAAATWLLVTVIGRLGPQRARFKAA